MATATNAQTLASQLERTRPTLSQLFFTDDSFFSELESRPKDEVSTRPERIPFFALNGGKSRAANLDSSTTGLGRGSGPVEAVGTLSPTYFSHSLEWTKLTDIATDNKEKAIASYAKRILQGGMKTFRHTLDSLAVASDGSNTLDTVVSYDNVNYIIYVNNATRFHDGQDVDIYNGGLGTAITTTATILSVDALNKALYLTGAPSAAPTAGGLVLESGSAGTANTGLYGINAYQVNANTGTYMGVSRASYPGKFSTPYVNAGSNALTPAYARLVLDKLKIVRGGDEAAEDGLIAMMGLDQKAAWEATGMVLTQVIQQQGVAKGTDLLPAKQVSTMGGVRIKSSIKYTPGRIDLLNMKHWFRQEVTPIDFYEAGGQTIFPIYGSDGSPAPTLWTALIWGGNIGCDNPLSGGYIGNLAIPQNY